MPLHLSLMKKISWSLVPVVLISASLWTFHAKTNGSIPLNSLPIIQDAKTIAKALHFIESNYVNAQSIDPFQMIKKASENLERSVPPLIVKENEKRIEATLEEKKIMIPLSNPMSVEDVISSLNQLLGFLDLHYKGKPEEQDRTSLALAGVTDTLDPHTNYLPAKIYSEFKIGTKGNFGGLGIVIGIRDNDLTVISPLDGTPASKAGILAKDKIIQINEESTINMGITEAVEKLRGPVGTKVSLMVSRLGSPSPFHFTLTRALIHIQSVAGRLLDNKKIGLIKIKNFQQDTLDQFKKTIHEFQSGGNKLEGLILDLRNNPGGLLDQAVEIGDYFLKEGVIVKTVGAHGEAMDTENAHAGDEGENIPLVVLINEGSASASEIVSGALQFNDRALVIGNRSFGKGSVQTVYDLKDGSALKLTIANYLTAKDQKVQSIGINPDVGLVPAQITDQVVEDKEKRGSKRVIGKLIDLYEDVKKREIDLLNKDDESEHKLPDLPPPPLQMTYLSPEKGVDKKDEEESTGKIDLKDDFPIHVAEKILLLPASQTLDRGKIIPSLPPLLEELKEEEQMHIATALKTLGVDWSDVGKTEPKGGTSNLGLHVELEDDKGPRKSLMVGDNASLKISIENKNSFPLYQLMGVTQSEDPLFANLEFPFGKLNPGEKREWKAPLHIPDFIHARSIPIEIEFHERYHHVPKSKTSLFTVQVEEPSQPLFQYSYFLTQRGKKMSSSMERGQITELTIHVKNVGKGISKNPVINLKNLDKITENDEEAFIEKGRVELPKLAPGDSADGVLKFRIPENGKAKMLSFDLLILDSYQGQELSDHLIFPLNGNSPTPMPEKIQAAPLILFSPEKPELHASKNTYTIKGHVTDDEEVKYLTVFVGDEKADYKAPSSSTSSMDFDLHLTLKKGVNLITLAAQDNRELITRKQWVVWRDK